MGLLPISFQNRGLSLTHFLITSPPPYFQLLSAPKFTHFSQISGNNFINCLPFRTQRSSVAVRAVATEAAAKMVKAIRIHEHGGPEVSLFLSLSTYIVYELEIWVVL
ncbi:hypothetical protein TB2_001654 [Malus domestica]